MVLPLKLVSFNTYLVSRHFNQNRVTFPERRAARIQEFLQEYDICFLQEVWGSGFSELTLPALVEASGTPSRDGNSALRKDANEPLSSLSLPPWRVPFLGQAVLGSCLAEIVYTFYLRILETGGLFDVTRPSVAKCVYRSKHTFTKSRSKSLKGVEATLWSDISAWDRQYNLLVFNVHLDPWLEDNRKLQVAEMVAFICSTIQQVHQGPDSFESRSSWSKTGVLIVGDFNVKATTAEYHSLFVARGWKDFAATTEEIDTIAQTYSLENSLVCYPEDCGRIDYIFGIQEMETDGKQYRFLPLKCLSSSIVRQSHGQEMSDHYPIAVELVPQPH